MTQEDPSRLDNEIELLTAIYPDQATYSPRSRELKFTQDHATLHLRIPDTYPECGLPDILSATESSKQDIRNETKASIQALNLAEGEESLDAIISAFQDLLSNRAESRSISSAKSSTSHHQQRDSNGGGNTPKTVIIWLHHLLNTSKRKLCLSPTFAGVTKPGYPGVLVYSGPAAAVDAHVCELKKQNWAAFQVRFEEEVEWVFRHEGVREVEGMGDVVRALDGEGGKKEKERKKEENGRGERQKEAFLRAVGIK